METVSLTRRTDRTSRLATMSSSRLQRQPSAHVSWFDERLQTHKNVVLYFSCCRLPAGILRICDQARYSFYCLGHFKNVYDDDDEEEEPLLFSPVFLQFQWRLLFTPSSTTATLFITTCQVSDHSAPTDPELSCTCRIWLVTCTSHMSKLPNPVTSLPSFGSYRVRGVDGSCAKHLAVESYTVIYAANSNSHTYYYCFSITRSLFHSRLKTFLFCKSFPPQRIPQTFTVTSEHIRFYFLVFLFHTF